MTRKLVADDSWDGILEDGETLLWQGQPDPSLRLGAINIPQALMGLFFMGFSVFWMNMAAMAGGFFWMFGLIFFFIGLRNSIGQVVLEPKIRRKTWYSLSNRRAFIASDHPWKGRSLKSYEIGADSELDYTRGQTDAVYFSREKRSGSKRSYWVKIGFENLPDGSEAYRLLQEIKKGQE